MSFSSKILAAVEAASDWGSDAMARRQLGKELATRGLVPHVVIEEATRLLEKKRAIKARKPEKVGPSTKMGRTWTF